MLASTRRVRKLEARVAALEASSREHRPAVVILDGMAPEEEQAAARVRAAEANPGRELHVIVCRVKEPPTVPPTLGK